MTTLLQRPGGTELSESSAHINRRTEAMRSSLQNAPYHAPQTIAGALRLVLGIVFTVIRLSCGFLIYTVAMLSVPLAPFLGLVVLVLAMIVAGLMIANAQIVLLIFGLLWSVARVVAAKRCSGSRNRRLNAVVTGVDHAHDFSDRLWVKAGD